MLQLVKKLKLYIHKTAFRYSTQGPHKFSHQNLFVITCRLPAHTKVFLQLEHNTELLLHW